MIEQDPKDILLHHLVKFRMKPKYARKRVANSECKQDLPG